MNAIEAIAADLFQLPQAPILSSHAAQWDGVQLARFNQPPFRIPEHKSPYHIICINAGAPVSLEQTLDGKTYCEASVPGDIGIYPAHQWQTFEWYQRADFLQLYLEPMLLNQISSEVHGKDTLELMAQPLPCDPVIYQIAIALQNSLKAAANNISAVSTKLYADTMTHALATHLVYHYSTRKPKAPQSAGQLSVSQLKRVTAYLEENLSQDISLKELANVIALSPFHFSRLFKATTGFSPHQYHIRCRIKRAKHLLLTTQLPLAHIAPAVGFSSQSHLNYHFKRVVGLTPTAFLKQ